ncbi:hypothetical protein [Streptomyces hoynatensis]|uniref:Uncharacterized protein n=1 Tax=Streptomyces hoynatensis TaxID=1141874 RepID=A0A3A9Z6Z8_9ACTN|nr:hypothetical protein [Streptomyces hoynatensis]RKN44028.1 hypothetical protein D7294_10180 [Streptomyces hoynatensis]
MTPVQVDWLTLLFCALGLPALLIGYSLGRSAVRRGEPMPGRAKATQGVGMALLLSVALMHMLWGG